MCHIFYSIYLNEFVLGIEIILLLVLALKFVAWHYDENSLTSKKSPFSYAIDF